MGTQQITKPASHSRAADHYGHQAVLAGNEFIRDDFAQVDVAAAIDRIQQQCYGSTGFNYPLLTSKLQTLARELAASLNRINGSTAKAATGRELFWALLGDARLLVEAAPADPDDSDRRPWITSAWVNDAWVDVGGRFSAFDIARWQADVMRQVEAQRAAAAEATWPDREAA